MAKPLPRAPQPRLYFFRQWRKFRGLTQEQAAERLLVDQSTLSRIERGTIRFGQEFLEAAAYAYQCEPADLLMRDPLVKDAAWSITDNLKKATPDQREQIQAVVEALIRRAS